MRRPWLLAFPLLALPLAGPAAAQCTPSATAACLLGRFQVEVAWSDAVDNPLRHPDWPLGGDGSVVFELDGDTVLFSFFDPERPEMIVKMIDGRPVNGHYWAFASAATNAAFTLTVTDTVGAIPGFPGPQQTYVQPQGTVISPIVDTLAFDASAPPPPLTAPGTAPAPALLCGPATLCLFDGRFEVEVDWTNQHAGGATGMGTPVAFSQTTGMFWFFNSANVELLVSVIDGREANNAFWVHVAGLTDIGWEMRIRDTETGDEWSHTNPPGATDPVLDHQAFPQPVVLESIPALGGAGAGLLALLLLAGGVRALRRRS